MIFIKNNITISLLFASLLGISSLNAQNINSVNSIYNQNLLALNIASGDKENELKDDETSALIPAASLYQNHWNNSDVRLNNEKMFDKNTTYILPLVTNGESSFVFPYKGKVISAFGYRGRRIHSGTDIKLNLNDEVVSAFDGVVRMAKRYSGYGNIVVIRHPNGLETCYSHLNKIKVKVNQEVKAGEVIGLGGRTGRATTTHLHFETRFLGDAFDSSKLLDYDNFTLKSDTLIIDRNTFIKTKKFVYKKNKKGKRIKVYINDTEDTNTDKIINNKVVVFNNISASTTDTNIVETKQEVVNENIIPEISIKPKIANSKKLNTYYKVRNGDTLSGIAKRNNTTVKSICKLNKIEENAVLSLGKKLKLR